MRFSFLIFLISTFISASGQNWEWAKQGGGNYYDKAYGIACDTSNNIIITGFIVNNTNFGGCSMNAFSTFNEPNHFFVKYDVDGNVIWCTHLGGNNSDHSYEVDVDRTGNVYGVGMFNMDAQFGSTLYNSRGAYDASLIKLDKDGNFQWISQIGGNQEDYAYGVDVDDMGNIFITGYFTDTAYFDNVPTLYGTPSATWYRTSDVFLAKYNPLGQLLWAKRAGGDMSDAAKDIFVDGSGNIFITGTFADTANFESTQLISEGESDIFLAKYNSSGNLVWAKQAGGIDYDFATAMDVNLSGEIFVSGYFYNGTTNFDGISLTGQGGQEIFIAKYDPLGNVIWARSAGSASDDRGLGVCASPSGGCFLTGTFNLTAAFGNEVLTSNGDFDCFIAKYKSDGGVEWVEKIGGSAIDNGEAIIQDNSGDYYLSGFFGNTVNIGNTSLSSPNSSPNVFLAKFSDTEILGLHQVQNSKVSTMLFPNPCTTELHFSENINIEKYEVINSIGVKVFESNEIPVNTSSLNNGIYTLIVYSDSSQLTIATFIKK